ncbi:MAG: TraB/GumN family protein, partial [Candidatus Adiutrix sp.]
MKPKKKLCLATFSLALNRWVLGLWLVLFFFFITPPAYLHGAHFLWSLTAPNGGHAYLLGSIHLAQDSLYPLPETIMQAFEQSDTLVVEVNSANLEPAVLTAFMAEHALVQTSKPLATRLSPETYALLTKKNLQTPQMDMMKPWLLALTIQADVLAAHGYHAKNGLDNFFILKAQSLNMPIMALETLLEQMSMFINMTPAQGDFFLRMTLLEIDSLPSAVAGFFQAWSQGDGPG